MAYYMLLPRTFRQHKYAFVYCSDVRHVLVDLRSNKSLITYAKIGKGIFGVYVCVLYIYDTNLNKIIIANFTWQGYCYICM